MVRKATAADILILVRQAMQVFGSDDPEALKQEFNVFLQDDQVQIFVAEEDSTVIGFAQCGLRRDYVEGTDTSPVGYLEGIFVEPFHRNKGIARTMLKQCESWAKEKGCSEFASDCELCNETSLAFHLRMGFIEANRIICFKKDL